MMRKHISWVLPIFPLMLFLVGCFKPTVNEVSLGKEFNLPIGQSASIAEENIAIKFVEVTSDSRCPQGATCIWAGEASCLVEIIDSGTTHRQVITQPGLSGSSSTEFQEYEITFDLKPYPQLGKEIQNADYYLQLVIVKNQANNVLK